MSSRILFAADPGWYIGAGAEITHLDPTVPFDILSVSDSQSTASKVVLGVALDKSSSFELQLTDLGHALLENDDEVAYRAADVVGKFHFGSDIRSAPVSSSGFYMRLGIGYLDIASDTALQDGSRAHLLFGVGAQLALWRGLMIRTDLEFFDQEAQALGLSLIQHFYTHSNQPSQKKVHLPVKAVEVPPISNTPNTGPVVSEAVVVVKDHDSDNDGVVDGLDLCEFSRSNYPVNATGCGLFNGVISGLYSSNGIELAAGNKQALDRLSRLLLRYPQAKVVMSAHTASTGNDRLELALTQRRLQNIGRYLRSRDIVKGQVRYLAYGSRASLRAKNLPANRIEIKESP